MVHTERPKVVIRILKLGDTPEKFSSSFKEFSPHGREWAWDWVHSPPGQELWWQREVLPVLQRG